MDYRSARLMLFVVIAFFSLPFFCAYADGGSNSPAETVRPEQYAQNDVGASISKLERSILELRVQVLERDKRIIELENSLRSRQTEGLAPHVLVTPPIKDEDPFLFASWTGVLLAAVSTIVTGLGVAIAILSFYGYRATIEKAEKVAANKAESVAATCAEQAAIKEIQEQIAQGRFDKLIMSAVDKVALSSINPELNDDREDS